MWVMIILVSKQLFTLLNLLIPKNSQKLVTPSQMQLLYVIILFPFRLSKEAREMIDIGRVPAARSVRNWFNMNHV